MSGSFLVCGPAGKRGIQHLYLNFKVFSDLCPPFHFNCSGKIGRHIVS